MKKIVFILLLFVSLSTFSQTSGKITYEIVLGDDPRELLRDLDTQRLRTAQALSSDLIFNLYFNKDQSFFEIENLPNDYSMYSVLFTSAATKPKYSHYSDLKNQTFAYGFYYKFYGKDFILEDAANYNWEITNEEKIIDNLITIKALGLTRDKQRIEAWFTPEIPVSAGPENFMGLPGLILELQLGYTKYVCKKIEFTKAYNSKIIKPTGAEIINYKTYDELSQKQVEYFTNGNGSF